MKKFTLATILGIAATIGITLESRSANAANLFFSGNFTSPNDAPSFVFTADGSSTVTIQSYSWGGGTNVDGTTTILPGGFDPHLFLFDGAGNWVNERDDDIGLDFKFTGILAAGTYQAVITAVGNSAYASEPSGNLADGFTNEGRDFATDGVTSAYAVDIVNVSSSPTAVPEPSSLIGTVFAGFTAMMFKRKLSSSKK
jgi:hypothetical protein